MCRLRQPARSEKNSQKKSEKGRKDFWWGKKQTFGFLAGKSQQNYE